jgi:hypothetical protein
MSKLNLISFSGSIIYQVADPYIFGYVNLKRTINAKIETIFLLKCNGEDKDVDILNNSAKKIYLYIRKKIGNCDFIYQNQKPREYSCSCENKCDCEIKTIVESVDHRVRSWVDLRPFIFIKSVEDLPKDIYFLENSWNEK